MPQTIIITDPDGTLLDVAGLDIRHPVSYSSRQELHFKVELACNPRELTIEQGEIVIDRIYEKDSEKVVSEISECQARILQTFVPTIIAIGLISVADRQKFAFITLVCSFAILFGSGLYVASLSYKIFRNSAFIQALIELDKKRNGLTWEGALRLFNNEGRPPRVLGSETRTISAIYATFSVTYVLMFYEISAAFSFLFGIVLALLAIRIWLIPAKQASYLDTWKKVLDKEFAQNDGQG